MDPFLRRVLEQREREMETTLILTPAEAFRPKCELCRRRMNDHDDGEVRRVCTACGGQKAQVRLEKQKTVDEKRQRLVDLVVPTRREPVTSAAEKRSCATCGKNLRADNTHDTCTACRAGGKKAAREEVVHLAIGEVRTVDSRKNFRVVASALGFDPDDLLEDFMHGWLERVKSSVRRDEL